MSKVTQQELLDAGAHFGHLRRKWHPKMAPYIFMERNGIHIIDLNKTVARIEKAEAALQQIAKSGKKILFVATKKQAKNTVADLVRSVNMPFVTERWPGGMLTNFSTIRKSIRKLSSIERMRTDGTYENISKRERLQLERQKEKLIRQLGSISELTRLPAAIFVVDIMREHIAVAEAKKLNIPTFAIVDTNSDPTRVDFPIPANDDATKSIALIMEAMVSAVREGLEERKRDKENAAAAEKEGEHAEDDGEGHGEKASAGEAFTEEEIALAAKPGGKGKSRKRINRRPEARKPAGGTSVPPEKSDERGKGNDVKVANNSTSATETAAQR